MRLSRLAISRRIAAIALYATPLKRDPQPGEMICKEDMHLAGVQEARRINKVCL